jgi:hypothetical protein
VAARVLEGQRFAYSEGLSIYPEDPLALLILNPEVIANGDQVLAHLVMRGAAIVSVTVSPS